MLDSRSVLVFSDSHGRTQDMINIVRAEKPYRIIHAGDYASDARKVERETGIVTYAVTGNCDSYDTSEERLIDVVIMGQKITVVHGDRYAAKYSYDRLFYLGQERGAKAVVFGHTHEKYTEYADGIWLVNPGSISLPQCGEPSYCELMVGCFGIVPRLKEYLL